MRLFDFKCDSCSKKFETLIASGESEQPTCPFCKSSNTQKTISRFWVAGRGDLRETTTHGCHEVNPNIPGAIASESGERSEVSTSSGHSCSSHCGHSSGKSALSDD